MGGECNSALRNFAPVAQRKDLKSAAVCQNGPVPCVETVKPAGGLQHLHAGPKVKMVGVAQNYLRLYLLLQILKVHAFNGTNRPDRHENRRFDGT